MRDMVLKDLLPDLAADDDDDDIVANVDGENDDQDTEKKEPEE